MYSVLGFQFAAEIPSNELSDDSCWETLESEDASDNNAENLKKYFLRINISPEEWCNCGNCETMISEKECTCCSELDDIV